MVGLNFSSEREADKFISAMDTKIKDRQHRKQSETIITTIYVTGSAKTGHFSNSCLLNIYNLLSQVYPLAKFQLHMLLTLGVTALQSSNNRKIDLYSRYRENKLQALTKTVVTYQRIEVLS